MSLAFKYVDHLVAQQMKGFYEAFEMKQPEIKENKMQVREALIKQSPSLALQRAAADEIAKLDDLIESQNQEIKELEKELREAYSSIDYYRNRDFPETCY